MGITRLLVAGNAGGQSHTNSPQLWGAFGGGLTSNSAGTWRVKVRADYTIHDMLILTQAVLAPPHPAATYRLRKSGIATPLSISVPVDGFGTFENTVDVVTLAPGDDFDVEAFALTVAVRHVFAVSFLLTSVGEDSTLIGSFFGPLTGWGPGTRYFAVASMYGGAGLTEAQVQHTISEPCTYARVQVSVRTNTLNGPTTITFRKDSGLGPSDGNQSVVIPAGTTGYFEDLINLDTVIAGDKINYKAVMGGTSGTIAINFVVITIIGDVKRPFRVRGGPLLVTVRDLRFPSLEGRIGVGATTEGATSEDRAAVKTRIGLSFNSYTISVVTNTLDGDARFGLRKTGVDELVVTVPAGATGVFSVSGFVSWLSTDTINRFMDLSLASSGSITLGNTDADLLPGGHKTRTIGYGWLSRKEF